MKPTRKSLGVILHTIVLSFGAQTASAQSFSINLGGNEAQVFTGTPGAIPVPAANWFNAIGPAGGPATPLDSTGNPSGAAVSWTSQNTWRSGGTINDGNGQLTKGYIDDSGNAHSVTIRNNPYLLSNVYVITASDAGGSTSGPANFRPVTVNGVAYTFAEGQTLPGTTNWTGQNWTDGPELVEGQNYLKIPNIGGLGIDIKGGNNAGGARGGLAGIQVENAYTGTFLYWDANGTTPGAGGPSPSGAWDESSAQWNTSADGTGSSSTWAGERRTAVFSAGSDATGAYTINIAGTRAADALIAEEGTLTLQGGTIALSLPAVVRNRSAAGPFTVNSALSGSAGLVLDGSGPITLGGANSLSGPAVFSTPSVTLAPGAHHPNLDSLVVATGTSVTTTNANVTTTGNINLNGANLTLDGSSAVQAANVFFNNAGTTQTAVLNDTSSITATGQVQLDRGSLTLNSGSAIRAASFFNRGNGAGQVSLTVNQGATLALNSFLTFGDLTNAQILISQTGGTVSNAGTTNNPAGNQLSNRWGHWGNATTTYNLSGGELNLTGAPLYLSWDSGASLNITGTGVANIRGFNMGFNGRNNSSAINLIGGRLNVGPAGILAGGTANKTITLGAGTLGALANWSANARMNLTGAHTIDTGAFNINLAGGMTGNATGSITKTGTGRLSMSGEHTFPGVVTATAGTLQLGGTMTGGAVLKSGTTLRAGTPAQAGPASIANLTLEEGVASNLRLGETADGVTVTAANGFHAAGNNVINLEGAPGLVPGRLQLFSYEGAIQGAGFSAFSVGTRPHIEATLLHDPAARTIDLDITKIETLVWSGANGGTWELNQGNNFLLSDASQASFFATDLVRFDDSAATGNVTLVGEINPGDLVVDNNTLAYVFSGSGISGTTNLTKTGTGTLILANENTYSGLTTVAGGILQVGDGTSGSLPSSGTVVVEQEGILQIMAPAGGGTVSVPITNNGEIRIIGPNDLTSTALLSGAGTLTKQGTGTFTLAAQNQLSPLNVLQGRVRASGGGGNRMPSNGTINLSPGTIFEVTDTNSLPTHGDAANVVMDNATFLISGQNNTHLHLQQLGMENGSTVEFTAPIGSYDGENVQINGNIEVTGSGPSSITLPDGLALRGDITFYVEDTTSSAAADLIVNAELENPDAGVIGGFGAGGVVKFGTGTLLLNQRAVYTGSTFVAEGTLFAADGLATSSVVVEPQAVFGGAGTIAGTIEVASGGTLSPGTGTTGTLDVTGNVTIAGSLRVELDGAAGDQLAAAGTLDIGGATLDLNLLQGGATRGTYVIATYGDLAGTSFASVTGIPAGYELEYAHGPDANQIALVNDDIAPDPYAAWASGPPYNLTGDNALPNADPDGDGLVNLLEFVLGGNPASVQDRDKLPTASRVGDNLVVTFRRSRDSAYLNPVIEYSTSLAGSWTEARNGENGINVSVTPDGFGTGIDRVEVRIPTALEASGRLFARLRVAQE